MEFTVTGLEQLPQQIDGNFEELKKYLNDNLQKYNNLVVTKDSIAAAKKSKADLNKLKTAIEERRKEIKREWNKPYDEFESKVKALVALIDEPVSAIDSQIKVFDEQRIEEKRLALLECYSENIGDLAEIIPFDKFLDPKWKNVTADLEKLKEDIKSKISKCRSEMKIISATCGNYTAACQQKFIDTLNISDALAEFKRLEELDRRRAIIEAEQNRKAEEAAAAAKVNPVSAPKEATPGQPAILPEVHTAPAVVPPEESTKTIDVRFFATTAAFRTDMKALCAKHGIEYGNVPKGV